MVDVSVQSDECDDEGVELDVIELVIELDDEVVNIVMVFVLVVDTNE